MDSITLNLLEKDKELVENYAELHGITLEKALIIPFLEKLEDELDIEFFKNYKKDENEVLYTTEEIRKNLGLDNE
jgi:hypothetical protein